MSLEILKNRLKQNLSGKTQQPQPEKTSPYKKKSLLSLLWMKQTFACSAIAQESLLISLPVAQHKSQAALKALKH